MKKIILIAVLVGVSIASLSQQTDSTPALTKQDYLDKSKRQKTIALATSIPGAVVASTGLILYISEFEDGLPGSTGNYNEKKVKTGEIMMIAGGILIAVAIPFSIKSGINKRKALSISLKNETVPQMHKTVFVYHTIPSVTFKLSI